MRRTGVSVRACPDHFWWFSYGVERLCALCSEAERGVVSEVLDNGITDMSPACMALCELDSCQ